LTITYNTEGNYMRVMSKLKEFTMTNFNQKLIWVPHTWCL